MASDAFEPAPALALDRFLDQTLSDNPKEADWGSGLGFLRRFSLQSRSAARPYNDPFTTGLRDPLRRMAGSELFGTRSFTKDSRSDVTLADISEAAAHLLDSRALDAMISLGTDRKLSPDARRMVVYHGDAGARRSILILDPGMPSYAQPIIVNSEAVAMAAIEGHRETTARALSLVGIEGFGSEAIAELLAIARPRVVVAPAPEMVHVCVPDPPWCADVGGEVSTVGALVRDSAGRRGVTVCHHGSGPVGTPVRLREGDAEFESEVALASPLMDTCFVPIGDNWRPAGLTARAGMLSRRAPGAAESHRFEGASSGDRATRIVAIDMGLPFLSPGRQLCVHTEPSLDYGDSGAALVNEDDRLVGFAFQRTPYGSPSPIAFASWIWAAAALDDLKLTLET